MRVEFKFHTEKFRALKLFVTMKGLDVEDELAQAAEALYQKHVPGNVKAFIASKEKPEGASAESASSAVE